LVSCGEVILSQKVRLIVKVMACMTLQHLFTTN
jgi:hypothetical protein